MGQCSVEENAITATALQTGDEVTGFNGKRLQRWHQLIRASYEDPKRMHRLHLRRQGETRLEVGCLLPEERTIRNEFNSEEPQVAIGVSNRSYRRPEPVENGTTPRIIERSGTWDATKVNLYAVAGLFTGTFP